MEDIESLIDKIDRLSRDFEDTPTIETADSILLLLSKLKLTVGIYAFEELRAYSRLESKAERYLRQFDEEDTEEEDREAQKLLDVVHLNATEDVLKFADLSHLDDMLKGKAKKK